MIVNATSKWAAVLTLMLLSAGAVPAQQDEPCRLDVFVSVPPQGYLVERIGGKHLSVHVLVQPGQNPHTLEITPKQMMQLSAARLYFKSGMPLEAQLVKKLSAGHKQLVMVDTNHPVAALLSSTFQVAALSNSRVVPIHLEYHLKVLRVAVQ